jgi:hypothetical protein
MFSKLSVLASLVIIVRTSLTTAFVTQCLTLHYCRVLLSPPPFPRHLRTPSFVVTVLLHVAAPSSRPTQGCLPISPTPRLTSAWAAHLSLSSGTWCIPVPLRCMIFSLITLITVTASPLNARSGVRGPRISVAHES